MAAGGHEKASEPSRAGEVSGLQRGLAMAIDKGPGLWRGPATAIDESAVSVAAVTAAGEGSDPEGSGGGSGGGGAAAPGL